MSNKKKVNARNQGNGAVRSGSVLLLTTFPDRKSAEIFAHKLLQKKRAACLNLVPGVTSLYNWKGKTVSEQEILVIGKTTAAAFRKLKKEIKSLHSYEVPELIGISIREGLPEYLNWISAAVKI